MSHRTAQRRRVILKLARKFDWHEQHSRHVARLCLQLFDGLRELHDLDTDDRELLEYAALLHDIGWHISGHEHHKHSCWLIVHSKMEHFTKAEITTLANLARYHRGAMPRSSHRAYRSIPKHARRVVNRGAALLRIADALDRSDAALVRSVKCKAGKGKVKFTVAARSPAKSEFKAAMKKCDLFEKTFNRVVQIRRSNRIRRSAQAPGVR